MDVGFGLYGALMVLCTTMAYVHARSSPYERHRAWAIRLFALTIGSWLYRMEYGLWFLLFGFLGRTVDFNGWFDTIMVLFFYLPQSHHRRVDHPRGSKRSRRSRQPRDSSAALGRKRLRHRRDMDVRRQHLGIEDGQRPHVSATIGRPPSSTILRCR